MALRLACGTGRSPVVEVGERMAGTDWERSIDLAPVMSALDSKRAIASFAWMTA